jgi:uncharacterized membrane protein
MVTTTNQVTTNKHTVVGVFDGPNHAEQALTGLKAAGFTPEQVSVVAQDKRDVQQMADNTDMAGEGAATGAVTGGVLGGLAGFLVGISAMVIPGIGPIVGTGILVSTLAGAGIGAAAGGLVGALTGQGVPEDDAREYEGHVKGGSILLTVHALSAEEERQARDIFDGVSGGSVRSYPNPAA